MKYIVALTKDPRVKGHTGGPWFQPENTVDG